MSKMYQISDEEFTKIVNNSDSKIEIIYKIGYTNGKSRHTYELLDKRIKELNIEKIFNKHINSRGLGFNIKYDLSDVLIENSTYNRQTLKKRLIKEGLLKYECHECKNNGSWKNKPLSLHLDHINGINNDNRIENLRFLCPNCHSQTVTYCGRKNSTKEIKIKKIIEVKNYCIDCNKLITTRATRCKSCATKLQSKKRPDKDTLITVLKENNFNFSKIGRIYNVSDNAVRKWCRVYNLL